MAALEPARKRLERHLQEAYSRNDADRVAFWSEAVEYWSRPVPDYARSELNQFSLKERACAGTSEAVRNNNIRGSVFPPKK